MMDIHEGNNDGAHDPAPRRITKEDQHNNNRRPREPRSSKKTVRFVTTTTIYRLSIPCASDMSPREKGRRWYDPTDNDRFKYEAARHAGVKIVRYDSETAGQGHHFAMVGDFDCKEDDNMKMVSTKDAGNNAGAAPAVGSAATQPNNVAGRARHHYNENEYHDRHGSVRRGLGYHFSRARKKARVAARSAVVAWQRTLSCGHPAPPSNDHRPQPGRIYLPSDGRTRSSRGASRKQLDKNHMMLALVSTKCSRVAREEAKWRGDVDYRVAYPERHAESSSTSTGVTSHGTVAGACGPNIHRLPANHKRKRHNGEVGIPPLAHDTARCKRQRTAHGGCGGRDELSPATISYLSGVLSAEV